MGAIECGGGNRKRRREKEIYKKEQKKKPFENLRVYDTKTINR